jgi:hypothetical protein
VWPENDEAWFLWLKTSATCFRSNGLGPPSLDYSAMVQVARIYQIDVSPCTFAKIQALEQFTIQQNKDGARDQDEHHSQGTPEAPAVP